MDFKPLILSFAKAKMGKTVETVASLPTALFIASREALMSAKTVLDWLPARVPTVRTYHEVAGVLRSAAIKDFSVVVVDDVTLMGRDTEEMARESNKGWDVWNEVTRAALDMFEAARQSGKMVVFTAHEKPARTSRAGKPLRGGIDMPCDLTETVTGMVDASFRGITLENEEWKPIHPHAFGYHGPAMSSDWAVGNRVGAPEYSPANLGEILRASGLVSVPRAPGMEWQEKVCEVCVERLQGAPALGSADELSARKEVLKGLAEKLIGKRPTPHALWALRDAEDRYLIRRLQAARMDVYTQESKASAVTV